IYAKRILFDRPLHEYSDILKRDSMSVPTTDQTIDLNVLVVEDDIVALQWLESILQKRVRRIIGVESAEKALQVYQNELIDLLLTDLTLPGMGGVELIDCIHSKKQCCTIVMTGYDDTHTLQQLINRHITFFMHKPIEIEQLFLILSQVEINIKSQRELAIKESLLRRQSVQASMGEMLSIISHQWKQPLAVINSFVAELQLKEISDEGEKNYGNELDQIEKQIVFLSNTVELFTNLFNPHKVPTPFCIDDLIDEALLLYQVPIESQNIVISVNNPVRGDRIGYHDELFHVLLILLSNTIDAFDPDQHDKSLFINVWEQNNLLYLTFEDNAGGISVEIIEKIFEPYFSTKPVGKGSGLGLYVAKMIIEGRGWGEIDIQSIPDGSRFILRLIQKEAVI
ncbi:MAG: hybrid sensor histidine kinase/response regulator, partial [Campylobacterales bacterium]|nr:hybrid sensor histidine kinase/response regulator [Campylobacterales bacterium]